MTASGCLCALHSITAASGYSYSNVFHPVSPRPNFPWPLMMFSSASLATCPEDEKCLGQMEKGERRIKRWEQNKAESAMAKGGFYPVHKHIFPNFSYCFYIIFLCINIFHKFLARATTWRMLKWNYKEVAVSSGTWKWLNEKPLDQYQSAKCALGVGFSL